MLSQLTVIFSDILVKRQKPFPDSDAESRFRSYAVSCLVAMPLMLGFGLYHLVGGNYLLAQVLLASYLTLLVGLSLLYRRVSPRLIYRLTCLLFFLLNLYLATLSGVDGSKILWGYGFPLVTFFLLGTREGAFWNMLLFTAYQFIFWNPYYTNWAHQYPTEFGIRFSLSFAGVATVTYFYEYFRFTYRQRIEDQNRQLTNEVLERKKAEEALQLSEEKYKAIYLQAAEGIIVTNQDGNIIESNPQIQHMLGYSREDLTGINIHNLIHTADLDQLPSQINKMATGATVRLERRLRTANGEFREFEMSGRRLDAQRIMLLYRDITKRKSAERALERANQELDKLANIDGLTQIANRRKFETTLQEEWLRLRREQLPLTIVLCDIDYFKQYNDHYGHQEGDACLFNIAQILQNAVQRPADLVARFGGEEFVLILPNTYGEGGKHIAEKIRDRIIQANIPHRGSACNSSVTLSFGVGSMIPPIDGAQPKDLLETADQALYLAKKNGRNRVEYTPRTKTQNP